MGEGESDLLESVRADLEKNGIALELRVARALRRCRLPVEEGFRYLDYAESKWREGDVRTWISADEVDGLLHVTFECKHVEGGSWVGIQAIGGHERRLADVRTWVSADTMGSARDVQTPRLLLDLVDPNRMPCIKVLKAFESKRSTPHDACRQALSQAAGVVAANARARSLATVGTRSGPTFVWRSSSPQHACSVPVSTASAARRWSSRRSSASTYSSMTTAAGLGPSSSCGSLFCRLLGTCLTSRGAGIVRQTD